MNPQYIKVKGKMTADTIGCSEEYFKKYIKGKPLKIIHSTSTHYVRVTDQNEEEWGLFPEEYALVTGLGSTDASQAEEAKKAKLLRPETG